jgi:hypothetical protein
MNVKCFLVLLFFSLTLVGFLILTNVQFFIFVFTRMGFV